MPLRSQASGISHGRASSTVSDDDAKSPLIGVHSASHQSTRTTGAFRAVPIPCSWHGYVTRTLENAPQEHPRGQPVACLCARASAAARGDAGGGRAPRSRRSDLMHLAMILAPARWWSHRTLGAATRSPLSLRRANLQGAAATCLPWLASWSCGCCDSGRLARGWVELLQDFAASVWTKHDVT
jgi:hypothetical protein